VWNFGQSLLYIDGQGTATLSHKSPSVCRRVYVRKDAVRPQRQQGKASARATTWKRGTDCIVDSHQARSGQHVGKTLLQAAQFGDATEMVDDSAGEFPGAAGE